jgi:peroxiredoxin Q/BCP
MAPKKRAAGKDVEEEQDAKKPKPSLQVGDKAPEFSAPNQKGETLTLDSFKDSYLVLYFYPKDATPGCTKEGIAFNGLLDRFQELNCKVLGVSADTEQAHCKFIDKHEFKFDLLSDRERQVIKAYGAHIAGNRIQRSTVLIDPQGNIAEIWNPVKGAEKHPQQVLDRLGELIDGE